MEKEIPSCRICFESSSAELLANVCLCKGSQAFIHLACMSQCGRKCKVCATLHSRFVRDVDGKYYIDWDSISLEFQEYSMAIMQMLLMFLLLLSAFICFLITSLAILGDRSHMNDFWRMFAYTLITFIACLIMAVCADGIEDHPENMNIYFSINLVVFIGVGLLGFTLNIF